jgi:hypothetical protein
MKKFGKYFLRRTEATLISLMSIFMALTTLSLALEHGTTYHWAIGIASGILAIILLDAWNWVPNLNKVDELNRQLEELKKGHAKLTKEHGQAMKNLKDLRDGKYREYIDALKKVNRLEETDPEDLRKRNAELEAALKEKDKTIAIVGEVLNDWGAPKELLREIDRKTLPDGVQLLDVPSSSTAVEKGVRSAYAKVRSDHKNEALWRH